MSMLIQHVAGVGDGVQEICTLSRGLHPPNRRLLGLKNGRLVDGPPAAMASPGNKAQLWVINRSISHELTDGGLFVLTNLADETYAISLPAQQDNPALLKLRRVRVKPFELRCESLLWKEIAGGVVIRPDIIVRRINNNNDDNNN